MLSFADNHYIAINDNFDSRYSESNELAPFKNLFNECYVKDTSKKIKIVTPPCVARSKLFF